MVALRQIKQWANFIKHPNAFLWCHEPEFTCLSFKQFQQDKDTFVIDQKVVDTHYVRTEKKQKALYKAIAGQKKSVVVVFPELVGLTVRFCNGARDFVDTVTSPMFKGFIESRSTLTDYFEQVDEGES